MNSNREMAARDGFFGCLVGFWVSSPGNLNCQASPLSCWFWIAFFSVLVLCLGCCWSVFILLLSSRISIKRSILLVSPWTREMNRSKWYSIVEFEELYNPHKKFLRRSQRRPRKETFLILDPRLKVEIDHISLTFNDLEILKT